MSKLPTDLIEIPSYNSYHGEISLKCLMYSPSQKALYNKGFLNKKINLNNKKNFYSYVKSENPMERKRICININRFIRQYPEYQNIKDNYTRDESSEKIEDKLDENKSIDKSIDKSIENNSNEKSDEKASPADANQIDEISENRFIDILSNYKD